MHTSQALRDLAHSILFFTAGDAVQKSLPDHVPYAEAAGVWSRSPERKALLTRHWQPYLDGEMELAEALQRLIAGLK